MLKKTPRSPDNTCVNRLRISTGRLVWSIATLALAIVTVLTVFGPLGEQRWENSQLLFSLTTVAAAICVVASTIVIALADRREMAEIGLLGTALMAASVMPLVHGLVTPGVLYDATEAFQASAFWALPVAVAVSLPLLAPRSAFGRWAALRWRDWTLLALMGVFVFASVLVFFPNLVVAPDSGDALTIGISVGMVLALVSMSLRQLHFYELGGQASNLIASLSLVVLSLTGLLPLSDRPYNGGFWWLHIAGAVGVLGACIGMGIARGLSRSTQDILAPILVRDPLVAFELGLSPVVHQFVADLEKKDQITRDHTIRTGEMAIRVGERLRLSGQELRELGLAAMLHDVGKLYVPDEILKKPARLTTEEYEIIKLHTVDGEQMLARDPSLAQAALIVRSHHERIDGGGYPDGLAGRDIPLAARIIAVCDAFDAMTHDRQYRKAMPIAMAHAILREHAGSQWDPMVIDHVMAVLPSMPAVSAFDDVGRTPIISADTEIVIPADIGELLADVDAEI